MKRRFHQHDLGFSQDQGTVNVSRWATFIRRLLNLKGPSLQGVDPELAVSVSETDRFEYWALAGVRPFQQSLVLTAAAAKFNLWTVRNPANSGQLVTVTSVGYQGVADDVNITLFDGTIAAKAGFTETNAPTVDLRLQPLSPISSLGTLTATAQDASRILIGTFQNIIYRNTSQTSWLNGEAGNAGGRPVAVLQPGTALCVVGGTVNIAQTVTFTGYERTLELSELKP